MGHNTWKNNIVVMAGASHDYYPPIVFTNGSAVPNAAATTTFDGLTYYQLSGRAGAIGYGLGAGGWG